MSDSDSTQKGNAGNLGDVMKHIALVGLLTELENVPGDILYVESHAFRPEMEIGPDRVARWREHVASQADNPAKARYLELQEPYVENGRYLCSVGIAKAILGGRADYVLCESGTESQKLLEEAVPGAKLLGDNAGLEAELAQRAGRYEGVVGLIDPYGLESIEERFVGWLNAVTATAPVWTRVVAFDYGRTGAWPERPAAPLVSSAQDGPYAVAIYGGPK